MIHVQTNRLFPCLPYVFPSSNADYLVLLTDYEWSKVHRLNTPASEIFKSTLSKDGYFFYVGYPSFNFGRLPKKIGFWSGNLSMSSPIFQGVVSISASLYPSRVKTLALNWLLFFLCPNFSEILGIYAR
jgi:hypothetical protein